MAKQLQHHSERMHYHRTGTKWDVIAAWAVLAATLTTLVLVG